VEGVSHVMPVGAGSIWHQASVLAATGGVPAAPAAAGASTCALTQWCAEEGGVRQAQAQMRRV
jgi:hypothetical protein